VTPISRPRSQRLVEQAELDFSRASMTTKRLRTPADVEKPGALPSTVERSQEHLAAG
jgi:hypothetical protein